MDQREEEQEWKAQWREKLVGKKIVDGVDFDTSSVRALVMQQEQY
jgi:hypothetical protein